MDATRIKAFVNSSFTRTIDVLASFSGIIILFPLLVLVAVAIKLDSRGPILLRQKRIGEKGEFISIHKFRTMLTEADDIRLGRQSIRNDSRVSKVGVFLRRTSCDELPQLFDVLLGTLTLVGPRPIMPYEAQAFERSSQEASESLRKRLELKPGITGWAQVNGLRGGSGSIDSFERMIEFDLEYMRRRTIWMDLRIILLTAVRPIAHENAY